MAKGRCEKCIYFCEYTPEFPTTVRMGDCRYSAPTGRFPRSAKITQNADGWYVKFQLFPATTVTHDYWCGDFDGGEENG